MLCEQTLWNWAQGKACEISDALRAEVQSARSSLPMPAIEQAVNIYDAEAEEVLVMTDTIQVKAQKPTRERANDERPGRPEEEEEKKKKVKRINTDLMLLEGRDGTLRHLSAGFGEGAPSLSEVAEAHL